MYYIYALYGIFIITHCKKMSHLSKKNHCLNFHSFTIQTNQVMRL